MNDPKPSYKRLKSIIRSITSAEQETKYFSDQLHWWEFPTRLLIELSLLMVGSLAIFYFFFSYPTYQRTSYDELKTNLQTNQVESITIKGSDILIRHRVGGFVQADVSAEQWAQIWPEIKRHDIAISVANPIRRLRWIWILVMFALVGLTYILMHGIEYRLSRWVVRPESDSPRNRYLLPNQSKKVTFKNIALPEQALNDLKRFLEFLKEPQKYQKLGAQIERGVLLVGPAGIGKTLAGSALAGEANVPFFWLSERPPNLSELHDFFDAGRKNAPSILFIDNIDSIAPTRSIWPSPETLNLEAMTTGLISFLDQNNPRDGVFVFAATNRPDLIDEALIRPGRLRVIELSYPTLREAESILKIHTRRIPLAEDVDISEVARVLLKVRPQCTGATIAEICNLAATLAAETSLKFVSQKSFLEAMEKVCDVEKRPSVMPNEIRTAQLPEPI